MSSIIVNFNKLFLLAISSCPVVHFTFGLINPPTHQIRVEETNFHRGRLWLLPSLKNSYLNLLGENGGDEVVVELVNNFGVLYALEGQYEKGEFQLFQCLITRSYFQQLRCSIDVWNL